MKKIGFIGVGNMGSRMCEQLISAKYDCLVFDTHLAAKSKMAKLGAREATQLKDFTDCDVIFTMLQNGEQVKHTLDELFQCAKSDTIFVDCSSIDIKTTHHLHEVAAEKGFQFIDSPVSGGVKGAEEGKLTIMVGGEAATLDTVKPLLEKMGQKIVYAGKAGCGQAAKMCNNMILGINMVAVSEAFNLAKSLGLEPKKLFEISSNASGQCWALTSYCPEPDVMENVPANNEYKPGFAAAMMLKDLNLSQDAAEAFNVRTSMGFLAYELYMQMAENGHGDLDFSAIIKELAN